MTCIKGPPCIPGKTSESISFAYFSLHKISPPRGPRRVLCVVVVTKSACSIGLGCSPAATKPARWAVSASQASELVVIDLLILFAHAVMDDFKKLSGKIRLVAVGQMPAVTQVHGEHFVPWQEKR